jgi:hypothetical protein
LLSAAIYGLNIRLFDLLPQFWRKTPIHAYLVLFFVLVLLYLSSIGLVMNCRLNQKRPKWLIMGILALAVAFRLPLIPQEPALLSSDMYRYIWDGRVQHNGYNPYFYPPIADELKNLRDDRVYRQINRKSAHTVYPAGAQLFFRAVYAAVGDSVAGFKGVMVACDMAAIAILGLLLHALGSDPNRMLIYAWNPLVVFEIAYSGHLEGVVVLLTLGAFYLGIKRKKIAGVFMLTISCAVKFFPALLIAALLNRGERIRGLAAFAAIFGLVYLPFADAGKQIMGFLPTYLQNPYESFNLGLKNLIIHWFPGLDYALLSLLFIVALAVAAWLVLFKEKSGTQSLYYGYILTGWLMILMPAALHPWYVIMIIPFLAFYPNAAWIFFSCSVSLSYIKYVAPQGIMPEWILFCEYLGLICLLGWGYLYYRITGEGAGRNRKTSGVSQCKSLW